MSTARVIRDGILERLPQLPFFHKFKFSRAQSKQPQPTDLPFAAVFLLPEIGGPDGDYNAGEPRFRKESQIGISVMLNNIEAEELEDALDAAFDVIMIGLLTDPSFMGFKTKYHIEGVSKYRRQNVFGVLGSSNETPTGELRLDLTFVTRTGYDPDVRDDLELIHIETVYPSMAARFSTQQVFVPIDLTVDSTRQKVVAKLAVTSTLRANGAVVPAP